MARKIAAAVSAVLLVTAAIAGISRVAWHERDEVFVESVGSIAELERRSRAENQIELARAPLVADQYAIFELCTRDGLPPDRWARSISLTIRPSSSDEGLTYLL